MSMGSKTFLIEEREAVASISERSLVPVVSLTGLTARPFGFTALEREPRPPVHPSVKLRNALFDCKTAGLRGSQIQEIWDEFVARQVLED